jgi:serine/threonine protein kinase
VIIDFGYAERLHAKWKPQMFYNVGSPSYMAPESYKQTNYTEKSDLWALGVVFFEILTGDTFDSNVKI